MGRSSSEVRRALGVLELVEVGKDENHSGCHEAKGEDRFVLLDLVYSYLVDPLPAAECHAVDEAYQTSQGAAGHTLVESAQRIDATAHAHRAEDRLVELHAGEALFVEAHQAV